MKSKFSNEKKSFTKFSYKSLLSQSIETNNATLIVPRDYQQSLIDFAKSRNTIIYLGTGMGKTLISIYVIKDLFNEPPTVNKVSGTKLERVKRINSPKVFFVAKSRNLIAQQAKAIDKLTGLRVGKYDGDSDVRYLNYDKWKAELKRRDVFVIIDKILLEILRHGIMRIEEISLLIFDECHHAEGQSDYSLIMKEYYFQCNTLNSTIAPFNNPELEKEVSLIESKHNIEILKYEETFTQPSLQYSIFVTKKVATAFVDTLKLEANEKKKLAEQYVKYIDALFSFDKIAQSKSKKLALDGNYFKPELSKTIELLNALIRKSEKIAKEIGIYGLYEYYLFGKRQIEEDVDFPSSGRLAQILQNAAERIVLPMCKSVKKPSDKFSLKTAALLEFLQSYSDSGRPATSSIVFVDERLIAYTLYKALLEGLREHRGVGLVMGHSPANNIRSAKLGCRLVRAVSSIVMDPAEQLAVIEKFRGKEFGVLVGTDVVEEGMDIPSCNLVCCFNPIKNVKSYIQMQGRARDLHSQFIILSSSASSEAALSQIDDFKQLINIEKNLALYVAKAIEPNPHAYKNFILPKESYIEVSHTGAKVCIYDAKSFLIKYCKSLPSDEFCKPFINYEAKEVKDGKTTQYIGCVMLPPMAPREVRYYSSSKTLATKEEAFDAVSFEVINELLELEKLNRFLLASSLYGSEALLAEINLNELEMKVEVINQSVTTALLNEIRVSDVPEQVEEYLYKLEFDPMFPYLNQENSLGFLFFKGDLATSRNTLILKNERVMEYMTSINAHRSSLNKEPYTNLLSDYGSYYAEKITYVNVVTYLSKPIPMKLTYEELLKLKCFHFYCLYASYCADFSFFQRICSGKDDFAKLFYEELAQLKLHVLKEDCDFIMSKVPSTQKYTSHLCFVPLIRNAEINFPLIDDVILYIKDKLKNRFLEGLSKSSINDLKGKMVATIYNNARYVVFDYSDVKLDFNMIWKDKTNKKAFKIKYWSYYKMKYNLELSTTSTMIKAKAVETTPDKRLMQVISCYSKIKYEELRQKEDKEKYLQSLVKEHRKDKGSKWVYLPLELCKTNPIPIDLYEIVRNTSYILSCFNDMTAFKHFKEEFFKRILVVPDAGNNFLIDESKPPQVSLSNFLQLHLLTEALISGAASEGYSYQRLEFLGDSVMRVLEAWDSFMSNTKSDIGEYQSNRAIKLSNKRLTQIGYKLGFDKLVRVLPFKGMFDSYIPPGFTDIQEYSQIVDKKSNLVYNSVAFIRVKAQKPFLCESLVDKDMNKDEEISSDEEEYRDKTIESINRYLRENEKPVKNLKETDEKVDYDAEEELKQIKVNKTGAAVYISDKVIADTVVRLQSN